MTARHYSDEDLRRYVSGRFSDSEAAMLERQLSDRPELEQRLLDLEPFMAHARDAFASVPPEDRLADLMPQKDTGRNSRWPLGLAVAASLAIAVGFGIGTVTAPERALDWPERIAIYQALYTPATIASLDPTDEELSRQFADGSAVLGRDIVPEMVTDLDGLDLRRAQILQADDRPIVQIVLAGPEGEPLAFCIVKLEGDAQPAEPVFQQLAGVPTAHWVDDDYGFMVVGRISENALSNTTRVLRARF